MSSPEKVTGEKVAEIFRHLIEKRVIIAMHMVGTDLERLTCVTHLSEGPEPTFVVDLPEDFKVSPKDIDHLDLRFNFNGPDRVEYLFGTKGGRFNHRELRLPLPGFVERIQRRKDFRVETPVGSKLFLKFDKIHAVLGLINISLGGAFAALLKHTHKSLSGSLLAENQCIANAGICVPLADCEDDIIIIVKEMEVRRVVHDIERKIYKYAFQFNEIDTIEKKKLTQAIYAIQRQFLQRR